MSEQTMQANQDQNNQSPQAITVHPSVAVQIVWQWLTYALWSWALIALSVLLSGTLAYYFANNNKDYEFLIYTLAILIVLLPLTVVTDAFYRKREPAQKHGFAAVLMVLHAVLVFLATIGALITAVVTIFTILLNPDDVSTKTAVILSSLVVAVMGGLFFVRIVTPPKLQRITRYFPIIVAVILAMAVLAATVGPFRSEVGARQDKLIEDNLETVNSAISNYGRTNKRLPDNLGQLDVSGGAKKLVDSNKVEYRPNTQPVTSPLLNSLKNTSTYNSYATSQATYELCVTYKKPKNNDSTYHTNDSTYLTTYSHKAGRQCYNQTIYISNSNDIVPLSR